MSTGRAGAGGPEDSGSAAEALAGAGDEASEQILAGVGERLRGLRKERGMTLAALSTSTGISVSTLSRLESGLRRPTLELLLPLARAHRVALDELVGTRPVADPRVRAEPIVRHHRRMYPLSRHPGGVQAYRMVIEGGSRDPEPRTHEGYEWMYVLHGRLRVVLGEHDLVLEPGEAAEFDTRVPHWFGLLDEGPVELLVLFGPQGERMHVRARPKRKKTD
ncbi:transcriptional regulator, XRE family with cupin sensor [Streptomyces sp. LcepLS]|nr:cupin domain-containing protein [Streptomyces sp. SID4945]SCF49225.1 transcriptional regulator, XRE family with cupin sensor [Streptomyces sp. LcepLS]